MTRRGGPGVVLFSALLHGALWLTVLDVERPPPPPPPPIKITVRDVPPPPDEPPPPTPEPEALPESEPETPAPEAPPPPEPPPPTPAPRKPRPEPAPQPSAPQPAPASDAPDFGLQLGNGGEGSGGLSVPTGDPGGTPGGGGKPRERVEAKKRTLDAKPRPPGDACDEAEVKPKPIELPQPQYTEAARAAAIQGKVRVQLTVAADGSVREAKVVSPLDPGLDEAALAAVKAARFSPATRCGKPVEATLTIAIKFSL